jgi:nitrite reductase/ring-hydroxylating ferredoxin subunit
MEHKVATFDELPEAGMFPVEAEGVDLLLCRHADGTVSAFRDRCTHADVALSGGECVEGRLTCPAHGAEFDSKTGRVLCMPAVKPLKSYPTRVVGGAVLVTLENIDR